MLTCPQFSRLEDRTGFKVIAFGFKGDLDIHTVPKARVPLTMVDFFAPYLGMDPLTLAARFEAFNIHGADGVLDHVRTGAAGLRKAITAGMKRSLRKSRCPERAPARY